MNDISESDADKRTILSFVPVSAWAWRYRVFTGSNEDKQPIAEVSVESIRNRGRIVIGDVEVVIEGKGWISPRFSFLVRDREIAFATTSSGFRTRFTLTSDGRTYSMQPRGLKSTLEVLEEDSIVGEIKTSGVFTRRGTLEMRRDVPTHDSLFLLHLAAYYWKMQAAAAS